jgi:hypothetical protein
MSPRLSPRESVYATKDEYPFVAVFVSRRARARFQSVTRSRSKRARRNNHFDRSLYALGSVRRRRRGRRPSKPSFRDPSSASTLRVPERNATTTIRIHGTNERTNEGFDRNARRTMRAQSVRPTRVRSHASHSAGGAARRGAGTPRLTH